MDDWSGSSGPGVRDGLVDGHVHLFPPGVQKAIYRWFRERDWRLAVDGLTGEEILAYLARKGVSRAVCCAYAHKPGLAVFLNDWLADLAREHPVVLPLGTVHPDDPDPAAEARRCLDELGFAGLKVHCAVQEVAADDARLFPVYEAARERGRPVLIHAGGAPYPTPWLGYERFAALMRRYPDLKVQVAHLGMWEHPRFLRLADRYPNLYFDLAAVTDRHMGLLTADLEAALRTYPERIVFGSDAPIIEEDYEAFVRLLEELGLPGATLRRVCRDNALALWGGG